MPTKAKVYISGIIGGGCFAISGALLNTHWGPALPLLVYLIVVLAGSTIKLRLPGLAGTYSAGFLALLYGLTHFGYAEMILAAAVSGIAQSLLNVKKRPQLIQVAFNVSNLVLSIALCFLVVQAGMDVSGQMQPAVFCGAAVVFFVVNTGMPGVPLKVTTPA